MIIASPINLNFFNFLFEYIGLLGPVIGAHKRVIKKENTSNKINELDPRIILFFRKIDVEKKNTVKTKHSA